MIPVSGDDARVPQGDEDLLTRAEASAFLALLGVRLKPATFADIERRLGAMLPRSADRPQWWANVSDPGTTHVQREAWREAGFDAFLIAGKDRVRFRRTK